jgi:hypothetical protein
MAVSKINNGFEQIKGFYSWVFENQDKNVRTPHIALYMFLINQNNRNRWVEWFKCPFDLAMAGSGITNKNTYYKTLNDLKDWELIQYQKGLNNYKAPLIKIEVLFDTSTVPQSEPQTVPQSIPLTVPLLIPQMANNIKHITSNIELVTTNIFEVVEFLKNKEEEKVSPDELKKNRKENFLNLINGYATKIGEGNSQVWMEGMYRLHKLEKGSLSDIVQLFNNHLMVETNGDWEETFEKYREYCGNWIRQQVQYGKLDKYTNAKKIGSL